MKTIEDFSVMESFGLVSEEKGLFAEVSELDMLDVTGGSCGAGSCNGRLEGGPVGCQGRVDCVRVDCVRVGCIIRIGQ